MNVNFEAIEKAWGKQKKTVLDELEEWLKENIKHWENEEQKWIEYGFIKFGGEANTKIIYKGILDKIQELKKEMK